MRKRIYLILAVSLLCLCFLSCVLSGCSSLLGFNARLDTPILTAIGNTIIWNPVTEALNYEIFCDEISLTTTNNTYYTVGNLTSTSQFYVVAKSSDMSKDSEKSQSVIVYKNANFSDNESMLFELSDNNTYTISKAINYVQVSGSAVNTSILISDRVSDIVVELDNVSMVSPEGKSCISTTDESFDFSLKHFAVTIIVKGTNELTGSNYLSVPPTPSNNSNKRGTNGGDGGSGLILPNIAIAGSGSLTLNGGNGGKGGAGAPSSGMSSAVYGHGGNGGNGGYGIKCTNIVLVMDVAGITRAYGGLGGERGTPGANGSVLTGPLNTANWSNCYGAVGRNATALIGQIRQLSGVYIT